MIYLFIFQIKIIKIKNNLTKFKVKFFNLNYYVFTDKELEIKIK